MMVNDMDKYTACELAYKNGYNEGYNKALEKFSNIIKNESRSFFRPLYNHDTIAEFIILIDKLVKENKKE